MKKIYYLKTCNTCQRILKDLDVGEEFELQDIKSKPLTVNQVKDMKRLAGSYEALFSRRAKLYKERDLKNEVLTEEDYKGFILEHYTFLSRPVIIIEDEIFIGNSKSSIEAAKTKLNE